MQNGFQEKGEKQKDINKKEKRGRSLEGEVAGEDCLRFVSQLFLFC